ncbi:MAG: hypothetical protein ACI9MR_004803 [Myxococcota bacterium]|jgi:hypothetical protein
MPRRWTRAVSMRGLTILCVISFLGCGGTSETPRSDAVDSAVSADTSGVADSAVVDSVESADGTETQDTPDTAVAPDTESSHDSTATADTVVDTVVPTDECPAPKGGIIWQGKRRFMHGINYAWHHFAGDFGGIGTWNQAGVSGALETHRTALAEMKARGVGVVRWWVWPDLRGDGIVTDGNGVPTGLGGTVLADLNAALTLAEEADVYLMLCLFSFDGFHPSRDVSGRWTPGLTSVVTADEARASLITNVVVPFAQAAAAHPHADRLLSWDLINEPEWAITGESLYGDPDFDPISALVPVSHRQMETFLAELTTALRRESDALITVGGAAIKWVRTWSQLDLDFDQFHVYDWIDTFWPYDSTPASYGLTTRPVILGEFPIGGLSRASYATMLPALWDAGYAGAMGWQYIEATSSQLDAAETFSDARPCQTAY